MNSIEEYLLKLLSIKGFLLDKKPGINQPKRVENAKILIANTSMDTDKIKVFGSRVKVDSVAKVAELELAEKEKMKEREKEKKKRKKEKRKERKREIN